MKPALFCNLFFWGVGGGVQCFPAVCQIQCAALTLAGVLQNL